AFILDHPAVRGGEAEGGVAEGDEGFIFAAAELDAPAARGGGVVRSGAADRQAAARASVQEGAGNARFAEDVRRGVQSEALADRTEVDPDRRIQVAGGEVGWVERDVVEARAALGRGDGGGVGPAAAAEPPGGHEGADGDVEGAARGAPDLLAEAEKVEEARLKAHPAGGGVAIQARDVAGGVEGAEGAVQVDDFGKGRFAGGAELNRVRALQDELEPGSHRAGGEPH